MSDNPENNSPMSKHTFYADLPVSDSLEAALLNNALDALPSDWGLIVSDVKASTEAVLRGEYRQVILLGVATIVTILNSLEDNMQVPFVFGGDGAVIALPLRYMDTALAELTKLQQVARANFKLELRVAAFTVPEITAAGHQVLVGRYRLSPSNDLAVFDGGGIQYIESKIKEKSAVSITVDYQLSVPISERLKGLECRWQPLAKNKGLFACLHVRALTGERQHALHTYKQLWNRLRNIYEAPQLEHPIETRDLKLALSARDLKAETLARSSNGSWLAQQRYRYWLRGQIILGMLLMYFNVRAGDIKWGNYTGELVDNVDFHSYCDGYTRVIPGTITQHQKLIDYLDQQCHNNHLVYGLHLTEKALITCHITHYSNQHIHFLDGDDGGLTRAMRQMKWRMMQPVGA